MGKKARSKNKKAAIWRKKVARYLAYCVDGGLLQKKFTLKNMIDTVFKLENDERETIHREIAYLLHCHKREKPWDIVENLEEHSKDIDP